MSIKGPGWSIKEGAPGMQTGESKAWQRQVSI